MKSTKICSTQLMRIVKNKWGLKVNISYYVGSINKKNINRVAKKHGVLLQI